VLHGLGREAVEAGHQIGNHSDFHARPYLRSARFVKEQIVRAQLSITEATGVEPLLFRTPYGVRWFGLREVQRQLNLLGVMWTGNGLGWKLPAGAVVRRLMKHACNGVIFCLHDGRLMQARPDIRPTLEAVRRLVPALSARGFRFETVSQILCPRT
jgi:peptidoglycan-N-acetylglucosamine deacetylase